ncbi:MAG TPA: amidase, partial [Stellaceae bacterium]|nr:amidase [Stellaceae bacterium]
MSDLHWLTAGEAASAIAAGKLSPVELATALLDRIERLDPKLHAFIRLDAEAALDAATAAEREAVAGRLRG